MAWAMVIAAIAGGTVAAVGTEHILVTLAGAVVTWIILAGRRVVRWRVARHIVTSERVIARTGVVARRVTEIPLTAIDAVHYHQRMFERLIGCGTLVITPAGRVAPTRLTSVRRPAAWQSLIWHARERRLDRTRGQATDSSLWADDEP